MSMYIREPHMRRIIFNMENTKLSQPDVSEPDFTNYVKKYNSIYTLFTLIPVLSTK